MFQSLSPSLSSPSLARQDASEALFGRLFVLGAAVRSGLLGREDSSDLSGMNGAGKGEGDTSAQASWVVEEVVKGLLEVAKQRSFLREPSVVLLAELMQQVSLKQACDVVL